MIKGVIFDFDGVIVDSEKKRFADLKSLAEQKGLSISEEEFEHMGGTKSVLFLKQLFPSLSSKEVERLAEDRRNLERQNLDQIQPIPGLKELLEWLKEQELKIAITSGSHWDIVDEILEINGIKDYFEVIVTGEEYETSKPNSECYLVTLEKMGLEGKEATVIEDSVAGIQAAKTAGCKTIGLMTYLSKEQLMGADVQLENHYEVLKYLKKVLA